MKTNPSVNFLENSLNEQTICIVGNNAKSVAAAMALTHYGFKVALFGFSEAPDSHIGRYHFDTSLIDQWQRSINNGSLTYYDYNKTSLCDSSYVHYWLFLDQLPTLIETSILERLHGFSGNVYFSGITRVGRIEKLAYQLKTEKVFYIPFVFLNGASVYKSTIAPSLLLVGEKTRGTVLNNTIINVFIGKSGQHHIDSLKTIEFTRSSMMNLLATKLSFINEMARLADYCQVDMAEVQQILALDERLGKGFLKSGWGYGGSTLPKENAILANALTEARLSTNIINEVAHINEDQKELIFRKLWRYFDSFIQDKTVLIWGAGYKRGTGRTKGSAIHTLLPLLWSHRVNTILFDPLAEIELKGLYGTDKPLQFIENPYQRLDEVDAIIIINWSQQECPDISVLNKFKVPVFDAKNIFSKQDIEKLQSHYTGIGRGIL